MNPTTGSRVGLQAQSEALQPSLWDRLLNDMPGLDAEIDSLRRELAAEIGDVERLDALIEGGARSIGAASDLSERLHKRLFQLVSKCERKRALAASGIRVTRDVLREAVRRDIEMLFNIERMEATPLMTDAESGRFESAESLLADFPEIRRSVLNYGVPSFTGRTGTDFDKTALSRELKQVLIDFEPRLKPSSIRVTIRHSEKIGMRIDVDAVLMLSPTPERLKLSTTIDLETGSAATRLEDG